MSQLVFKNNDGQINEGDLLKQTDESHESDQTWNKRYLLTQRHEAWKHKMNPQKEKKKPKTDYTHIKKTHRPKRAKYDSETKWRNIILWLCRESEELCRGPDKDETRWNWEIITDIIQGGKKAPNVDAQYFQFDKKNPIKTRWKIPY